MRVSRSLSVLPFVILAVALSPTSAARAIELSLDGEHYWAVLSSQKTADEAIGVAYNHGEAKPIVVRDSNGVFAVISGPLAVPKGAGRKVLDRLIAEKGAPRDAYLTHGASFTETVWTEPETREIAALAYDGETDATLDKADLSIRLSRQPASKNPADGYVATATGIYKGKPAFKLVMTSESPADKPSSSVALVRLDPDSPAPQVVFTYFSQGAHCCTLTKIATLAKDRAWHVVDGEMLDGGGGYVFEDIEGKGFSNLVSYDQNFYYAFDSYAGSVAPLQIHQLVGDHLVDVTRAPQFKRRLVQQLYSLIIPDQPDSWHSNGFLAGWVASSMLIGDGDTAWAKMLANYDHHSEFATEKCTIARPLEKCPDAKKAKLSFPFALREFLMQHGYIGDPKRYIAPYEIERG